MDYIDDYLEKAGRNFNLSKPIRAALAIGKETLNRYYNKTDQSDVYRIAMGRFILSFFYLFPSRVPVVLHPRHKLQYFKKAGWDETWIKTSRDIVRTEFDGSYAFMDIDVESQDTEPTPPSVCIFFFTLVLNTDVFFSFSALPLLKTYLTNCRHFLPLQKPIFETNSIVISAPTRSMSQIQSLGGTRNGPLILVSIAWHWITWRFRVSFLIKFRVLSHW